MLRALRRLLVAIATLSLLSVPFAGPDPAAAALTSTVSISPTTASAGVATSFTVAVTNTSTAPQTQLECVRVAVPAGVTLSGTPTVAALDPPVPPGTARAWSAPTVVSGALETTRTGGSANVIDPGGRVSVTFTATAASAGNVVFTTTAFGQSNCSGQQHTLSGSTTVTVSASNTAPVLDAAGTPSLGAVLEDSTGHTGDSVPAFLASGGGGYVTDPDAGAVQGVAVIGVDTANGTWEYSTNGGGSWSSLAGASPGTARLLASAASNRIRFVPNADYNGSATLTVRAWDQTSGADGGTADTTVNGGTTAFSTATDTATITVQPVNDAPSFVVGADQTVAEDAGPQTVPGWATGISAGPPNESGQATTFNVTGNTNPALFATPPAVDALGTLTYTPAPDANGPATITLVATDDGGTPSGGQDTSTSATFAITVTSVNDAPTCTDGVSSTPEDTPLNDGVTCSDVDGDTLTVEEASGPSDGTLTLNPDGSFTYDPDPDFTGVDSFTFTATDGDLDSAEATFTITVGGENDAPVLDPIGPRTMAEGSTLTFTASASDVDVPPDTLSFSLSGAPAGASIDPTSGEFSWTAPNDTVVTFDVCVTDGTGQDCESVTVTVTNVAPTVGLSGPQAVTAGETHTYSYVVTDPGADAHAFSEGCGGNATWIDTPAPNSFDCHFDTGPSSTTAWVTADDGDEVNGTGGDTRQVAVAAAVTPSTPSPSPSPPPSSPSQSPAPSESPAAGSGELPDTALGASLPLSVLTWVVAAVLVSSLALALGGGATASPRRRVQPRR
jgi:VCBS repeat-containing protein